MLARRRRRPRRRRSSTMCLPRDAALRSVVRRSSLRHRGDRLRRYRSSGSKTRQCWVGRLRQDPTLPLTEVCGVGMRCRGQYAAVTIRSRLQPRRISRWSSRAGIQARVPRRSGSIDGWFRSSVARTQSNVRTCAHRPRGKRLDGPGWLGLQRHSDSKGTSCVSSPTTGELVRATEIFARNTERGSRT